jgi:hypothetical protein
MPIPGLPVPVEILSDQAIVGQWWKLSDWSDLIGTVPHGAWPLDSIRRDT